MYTSEMTFVGRMRALLREVQSGELSEEDATLRLRGELIAAFFRGAEAEKKHGRKDALLR